MLQRIFGLAGLLAGFWAVAVSGPAFAADLGPTVVLAPAPLGVVAAPPPERIYVVDQGPVYSGPNLVRVSVWQPARPVRHYPYVHSRHGTRFAGARRAYVSGPVAVSPPGGTVVRARAELHYISPERMDIRLYRAP